jgi:hypothetical protein
MSDYEVTLVNDNSMHTLRPRVLVVANSILSVSPHQRHTVLHPSYPTDALQAGILCQIQGTRRECVTLGVEKHDETDMSQHPSKAASGKSTLSSQTNTLTRAPALDS